MHQYPFTAIVGQPLLKQALLLCAVNPAIGGLLIKGEKGTAKSTAVRGLTAVMPLMQRIKGSVFNSTTSEWLDREGEGNVPILENCPVPLINLPLGASEDRVLGSLDLEAILTDKKKQLLPGILAQVHRGMLYIDEVNLLADHLVDILLDVSASGINTIQREGLSVSHPARFVMIGTMNPEEGNLRPQFLDRFGMMVEVESHLDVSERTEVVRRRIAFERNPEEFCEKWESEQQKICEQIAAAQRILPEVQMPEGLLSLMSELCIERSVASLRADIVLYKTALALAAWRGLRVVTAQEVRVAAELVLIHRQGKRATKNSAPRSQTANQQTSPEAKGKSGEPDSLQSASSQENDVQGKELSTQNAQEPHHQDHTSSPADSMEIQAAKDQVSRPEEETTIAAMDLESRPKLPEYDRQQTEEGLPGRRNKATHTTIGQTVHAGMAIGGLALSATLQEAISRDPENLKLKREDFRFEVRNGKVGNLILLVVDASGSMAVQKRMALVKGTVLALLQEAYEQRDRVGVIIFRGVEAQWLLTPTNRIEDAEVALETLPSGGRTPLAGALKLAKEAMGNNTSKDRPYLVCLSDGKANVPLPGGGDPWLQALGQAEGIANLDIPALVVDTENGYLRLGRAAVLAKALKADCLTLDELEAGQLTEHIRHFGAIINLEQP